MRIRTVKPEFWTDEGVAALSIPARLLWIATWNLADDEGILRWTPEYIKSQVFPYDPEITVAKTEKMMNELVDGDFIYPYFSGRVRQKLGFVIRFRKHQKINRPQIGRLPPPNWQLEEVRKMYGRRDEMICGICHETIFEVTDPYINPYDTSHPENMYWEQDQQKLSVDHIIPRSKGGSDYPSNLQAAHISCNKGKRDRVPDSLLNVSFTENSLNETVNDSLEVDFPFSGGTGNREREEEHGTEEGEGESKRPLRKAKGSHVPDEFPITDKMRTWAKANNITLNLEEATQDWLDFWRSEGTLKADWEATWRNGMRSRQKRAQLRVVKPASSFEAQTSFLLNKIKNGGTA